MMAPVTSQLFERLQAWAERFPQRPAHRTASAGTTATQELTYAALLTRARAVASHLRARFPGDGSPVLVLGHKEPEMLAGFLGAVGSGHPYIPVDDSLPAHRVENIARLANAATTLTPPIIAALPAAAGGGELVSPKPSQPFYIIFTSGSTGEPKGVDHHGWMPGRFSRLDAHGTFDCTDGTETFLNQAPFSFDLSVMDLYLSLATGGTLHSITRRELADFRGLYRGLFAGGPDHLGIHALFRATLPRRTHFRPPNGCRALRHFLFCGETLLPETAARLLERFPVVESLEYLRPDGGHRGHDFRSHHVPKIIALRRLICPSVLPRPGTRRVSVG